MVIKTRGWNCCSGSETHDAKKKQRSLSSDWDLIFVFRAIKLSQVEKGGVGTHRQDCSREHREGAGREWQRRGMIWKKRRSMWRRMESIKSVRIWGGEEMAENWKRVDGQSDGEGGLTNEKLWDYCGWYSTGELRELTDGSTGRCARKWMEVVEIESERERGRKERLVLMDEGGRRR